jgi:hypothetical protein
MKIENSKGTAPFVSKNTKSEVRRKFLKRVTAGVVIASIPGRSAWTGIAGSIVASGHGSDFNQGAQTVLLDACTVAGTISNKSPINGQGNPDAKTILEGSDPDVNDVNAAILTMLFNAINHGNNGINYPVLSQHNDSSSNFADYLYAQASANPSDVASLLWATIVTYSDSGSSVNCTMTIVIDLSF